MNAMVYISAYHVIIFSFLLIVSDAAISHHTENKLEIVTLDVGNEKENESLPLHMGQRVYQLSGLRQSLWYEVKISYPASIPAAFSIQLIKGDFDRLLNRKLLNTEKLIFKATSDNLDSSSPELYIIVTVEPAGVVAQLGIPERDYILFNIVCDELSLGIPHKAWYVGMVAVLCLAVAFVVPYFLPHHLIPPKDPPQFDTDSKTL